jgi:DNA-binding protein HU-beta
MNLDELKREIDLDLGADSPGKADIGRVLASLGRVVTQHLDARHADADAAAEVTLPGLGKLVTDYREARPGRNPRTGEAVTIEGRRVVKFRPSQALKDAVAGEG